MKIYKKLSITLIVFILTHSIFCHSSETCKVEKVSNPLVKDRALSIIMNNGSKLTLVGHNHGSREIPKIVFKTVRQIINGEIKYSNFKPTVERIISEPSLDYTTALAEAKNDMAFLELELTKTPKASFISCEATAETVRKNTKYMKEMIPYISSIVKHEKLSKKKYQDDLLLEIVGGPNYLSLVKPNLFKDVAFVGLEDELISQNHTIKMKNFDLITNEIDRILDGNENLKKFIVDLSTQLEDLYYEYVPKIHDKLVFEKVDTIKDPNKELIVEYFRVVLDEMKARKKRDHVLAVRLIEQQQSGIMFIGDLHIYSIMNILQETCLNELNSNIPTSSQVSEVENITK